MQWASTGTYGEENGRIIMSTLGRHLCLFVTERHELWLVWQRRRGLCRCLWIICHQSCLSSVSSASCTRPALKLAVNVPAQPTRRHICSKKCSMYSLSSEISERIDTSWYDCRLISELLFLILLCLLCTQPNVLQYMSCLCVSLPQWSPNSKTGRCRKTKIGSNVPNAGVTCVPLFS